MRRFLVASLTVVILTFFPKTIFAASDYVLPYPSFMPGTTFYKVHLILEFFQKYWYFGNFGQFQYNLQESDKYLVEAKTLFEYKQYLLGVKALENSNRYFTKISQYLFYAQKENKSILEKQNIFHQAAEKHKEILEEMKARLPEKFVWQPEKSQPTILYLHLLIDKSVADREIAL